MTYTNDQLWRDVDAAGDITPKIALVLETLQPGQYRFSETYPVETMQWTEIARRFRTYDITEISLLGYRMEAALREMDATDRIFTKANAEQRQKRKQYALLVKAIEKLEEAAERLKPLILAGVL